MICLELNPRRIIAQRNPMIYGHFLEHFHRQIYGGVFDPGNPLSDASGFRKDVLEALRKIKVPVIRWPGGCFVSAYDWKEGVGKNRQPVYDKAWMVEEPNTFGTDEYYELCEKLGSQMYICSNAGTGTAEQMSDWLEYTNQQYGKYARWRRENGHPEPYNVRYFSVGNENYGDWEIGAKECHEWARLVTESAKMLKRVDPDVELSAASLPNPEWTMEILRNAGRYLSWISIHQYWDGINATNDHASYEQAMAYTFRLDDNVRKVEGVLAATGYEDQIKIAFDEWNLQGWYHPNIHNCRIPKDENLVVKPRDKNDDNSQYTMTDAVFSACVLNMFLRHSRSVHMANFAPTVNTRGLIYTHHDGIVLRPTYHVFDLFVNRMGETVVDLWEEKPCMMDVTGKDGVTRSVPVVDSVATLCADGKLAISLVNKLFSNEQTVSIKVPGFRGGTLYTLNGDSAIAYNDVDVSNRVAVTQSTCMDPGNVTLPPHSVSVLVCEQA